MLGQSPPDFTRSRTGFGAGRPNRDFGVQSLEPVGGARTHSRTRPAAAGSRAFAGIAGAPERLVQTVVVRGRSRPSRLLCASLPKPELAPLPCLHHCTRRPLVA